MTLPYPYFFHPDGSIGRQDFWKGEPLKLVCFAKQGANESSLRFEEFAQHPKRCIGLYPVFEHHDGEWYTYRDPIERINIQDIG